LFYRTFAGIGGGDCYGLMLILAYSYSMGYLWCIIRVLSGWDLHRGLLSQDCSLLHQGLLGKGEGTDVRGGKKEVAS
jgi:hypothetical protein